MGRYIAFQGTSPGHMEPMAGIFSGETEQAVQAVVDSLEEDHVALEDGHRIVLIGPLHMDPENVVDSGREMGDVALEFLASASGLHCFTYTTRWVRDGE